MHSVVMLAGGHAAIEGESFGHVLAAQLGGLDQIGRALIALLLDDSIGGELW